jgi:alcohol dehydrogenase
MFGVPVAGDWGGLFDELVRVPFAASMLVPLPPGIDLPAAASAGDNLPLALEAVAGHLRTRSEADVLILGVGSIGLFAIEIARALGAGRVVYVDGDDERVRIASDLGAETARGLPAQDLGSFDLVLDASGNADWLRESLRLLKPEGTCESVGGYFEDVSLPLFEMFVRGTRFRIARGNAGPNIPAALEMIARRDIAPGRVISEVLPWDEAPASLADPSLKPLFLRDQGVV